jgi:phosphoketolase
MGTPLSPELLRKMHAYRSAANYLSVGHIYLFDNPRLCRPLELKDIKLRLLGHWGTTPGLRVYTNIGQDAQRPNRLFSSSGSRGEARRKASRERPRRAMIVLRTRKGWTGPKKVDGQNTESYWRSQQVPMAGYRSAASRRLTKGRRSATG